MFISNIASVLHWGFFINSIYNWIFQISILVEQGQNNGWKNNPKSSLKPNCYLWFFTYCLMIFLGIHLPSFKKAEKIEQW